MVVLVVMFMLVSGVIAIAFAVAVVAASYWVAVGLRTAAHGDLAVVTVPTVISPLSLG